VTYCTSNIRIGALVGGLAAVVMEPVRRESMRVAIQCGGIPLVSTRKEHKRKNVRSVRGWLMRYAAS